jgi:transposase
MPSRSAANKKYVVRLSADERAQLDAMIRTGKRAAQMLMKARILLAADVAGPGLSDGRIVAMLGTSRSTVERVRQRLVEEGLEAALVRKPQERPSRAPIFDGVAEAKLIALACSPPPPGHVRWTLRLLEEKVVALDIVTRASDNTIGRTLKKTLSNPIGAGNG